MKAIGRHIILEMWGCQNLDSVETAERALREMVVALDVNLLDLRVYPFSPVGVTGIAIVSESHLVIHTWPEHGFVTIDVYVCNYTTDNTGKAELLFRTMQGALMPQHTKFQAIHRGGRDA